MYVWGGSLTWHRLNLEMVICHTLPHTTHALSFKEYTKQARILKVQIKLHRPGVDAATPLTEVTRMFGPKS